MVVVFKVVIDISSFLSDSPSLLPSPLHWASSPIHLALEASLSLRRKLQPRRKKQQRPQPQHRPKPHPHPRKRRLRNLKELVDFRRRERQPSGISRH